MRISSIGIVVCAFASIVAAQTGPAACPTITVSGPGVVWSGSPMVFSVDAKGGSNSVTGYEWSISAGSIASGQGTRSITVDASGLPPSSNVTATANVKGVAIGCSASASETGSIAMIPEGDPADSYGKIKWTDEKYRVDNGWFQLRRNPDDRLYISLRADKGDSFGQVREHARKIIKHILWRDKKFDVSRVIFGIKVNVPDDFTRHYLVPPGAELPECKNGCSQIVGSDLVKN